MYRKLSRDSKKEWTVDEVMELISMYRDAPELWDKENGAYCKTMKDQALAKMAMHFDTDIPSVGRKLHNLRTQHFDEVRKVEKTRDLLPHERFIPKWIYYRHLLFLTRKSRNKENQEVLFSITFSLSLVYTSFRIN